MEQELKELRSIKLYWKGNLVMCTINDTTYYSPEAYLKAFTFKKRFYMYLTKWFKPEEIEEWKKNNAHKSVIADNEGENKNGNRNRKTT